MRKREEVRGKLRKQSPIKLLKLPIQGKHWSSTED